MKLYHFRIYGIDFSGAFDKYFKFFWVCDMAYPNEFKVFFAIFDNFFYKTKTTFYNVAFEKNSVIFHFF